MFLHVLCSSESGGYVCACELLETRIDDPVRLDALFGNWPHEPNRCFRIIELEDDPEMNSDFQALFLLAHQESPLSESVNNALCTLVTLGMKLPEASIIRRP